MVRQGGDAASLSATRRQGYLKTNLGMDLYAEYKRFLNFREGQQPGLGDQVTFQAGTLELEQSQRRPTGIQIGIDMKLVGCQGLPCSVA